MQLTDANDAFNPTKNDDVTSGPRLFLMSMEFTFQASSALTKAFDLSLLIQILLESDNKADGKTPIAVPTPVVVDNEPETETEMPPNGRQ